MSLQHTIHSRVHQANCASTFKPPCKPCSLLSIRRVAAAFHHPIVLSTEPSFPVSLTNAAIHPNHPHHCHQTTVLVALKCASVQLCTAPLLTSNMSALQQVTSTYCSFLLPASTALSQVQASSPAASMHAQSVQPTHVRMSVCTPSTSFASAELAKTFFFTVSLTAWHEGELLGAGAGASSGATARSTQAWGVSLRGQDKLQVFGGH